VFFGHLLSRNPLSSQMEQKSLIDSKFPLFLKGSRYLGRMNQSLSNTTTLPSASRSRRK